MGSSRTQKSRSQRRSSLNEKAVCLIHRLFSDPCGSAAGARSAAGDHFYRNHPSGGWRGARNHPDTGPGLRAGRTNEKRNKDRFQKECFWTSDVERIFERNVYLRREESHLYIKQHNRQYSCYFLEAFQQKCRQDR